MISGRLSSLAEVAEKSANPETFWLWLRPKHFPTEIGWTLISRPWLSIWRPRSASAFPAWTQDRSRFLQQPYFAFNTHEGRMFLIADSPTAFRARNIFVGADALSRI